MKLFESFKRSIFNPLDVNGTLDRAFRRAHIWCAWQEIHVVEQCWIVDRMSDDNRRRALKKSGTKWWTVVVALCLMTMLPSACQPAGISTNLIVGVF